MTRANAADQIGATGCWLVAIVAGQEDVLRYRRPVAFFRDHLRSLLGVQKLETFHRARRAAMDAGWLECVHPPKGSRKPTLYWSKIPSTVDGLPDSAIDEQPEPDPKMETGDDPQNGTGDASPEPKNGSIDGSLRGSYSNLSPNTSSCSQQSCSPIAGQDGKQSDDLPWLAFPTKGNATVWTLTTGKLSEYRRTLSHLDVEAECRKAWQWIVDNPSRRKKAAGMPRFLSNWFSRVGQGSSSKAPQTPPAPFGAGALTPKQLERMREARARQSNGGTT